MQQSSDIIVLGGGPAGSSAAISLSNKGYSVTLLEKTDYSGGRIGESLPPQSISLLHQLTIGPDFFDPHTPSYCNQSVWGRGSVGEHHFLSSAYGNGWHLDRKTFDRQLASLAGQSGVHLFMAADIRTIRETADGWEVRFVQDGNEKIVKGRFAVDATGRKAALTKRQGGKKLYSDHLIALASITESRTGDHVPSNFTLVEAAANGWWYSADLPGNKTIVSFMTDADLYKRSGAGPGSFFSEQLSSAPSTKKRCAVGNGDAVDIFPAGSYIMSRRSGKNWLAIGDAAMAYDPLSSMGISKALQDGILASRAIHSYLDGEADALEKLAEKAKDQFTEYLGTRAHYYNLETRWKDSVFWKRRQGAGSFFQGKGMTQRSAGSTLRLLFS